jgi:hypothetical protein
MPHCTSAQYLPFPIRPIILLKIVMLSGDGLNI